MKPGQTVCNERNEKGKICAGPLKRLPREGYRAKEELEGTSVTYRCGKCLRLYQGPPLGYLRDPQMKSFVLTVPPDIVQPAPPPAHEPAKKEPPAKPAAEAKPAGEAKPKPVAETQPLAEAKPPAEAKPAAETQPLVEAKSAAETKPTEG
jgi:hypothetical protein